MKRKSLIKGLIIVVIILTINYLSYFINYLKFNNKPYLEKEIISIENNRLKKENEELKEILNIKNSEKIIITKLLSRSLYNYNNEIIIENKVGITVNSAVINENGLIGIVNKVDKNKAYVKLLSSNFNVSVRINDTYGNLVNKNIELLDKYTQINIGDNVYTSNLTNIPADIYIGKVISINYDENNLGQSVKIDIADNNNLNYVGVVTPIWYI